MRQIKFKAVTADGKRWVEGDLVHDKDKALIIPKHSSIWANYLQKEDESYQKQIRVIVDEVLTETVSQFTGLTDNNGKEVWEGDIVKCHYFYQSLGEGLSVCESETEIIGEIRFEEQGLWIQADNEDDSVYLLWINGLHEESLEVIGNIHDTKIKL